MSDFIKENGQLKRCPFCGTSDVVLYKWHPANTYSVECQECGVMSPECATAGQARSAWNRRDDADEQLIAHATKMYELLRSVLNADNDNLDPDLIGDIMYCLKEINGRW